jgi:hypothetical protein
MTPKRIIILILAALFGAFIAQNFEAVSVRFLFWKHTRFDRWTGDEERRIVAGEHWGITSDQLYPVVESSMPIGS